MTEFARLIGSDNSTISRYESGRIVPSKTVLILLLLLAQDDESKPIRDALGIVDETEILSKYSRGLATLADEGRLAPKTESRRKLDPVMAEFVHEAVAIAQAGEKMDPAVVQVLHVLRTCGTASREMRECFRKFLNYLEISLSGHVRRKMPK